MMLADLVPNLFKGIDFTQLSLDTIPLFITNIIQILLILGGALAVIFIAWAGIRYAASQGDAGHIKEAKAAILNAVVGLLLSSSAYILVSYISTQFDSTEQLTGPNATIAQTLGIPTFSVSGVVLGIVNVLDIAVGVVSVLFIVIGGIRYTTSNGSSQQIEGAKNTITYAVIGLVISLLAGVIVSFVLSRAAQ